MSLTENYKRFSTFLRRSLTRLELEKSYRKSLKETTPIHSPVISPTEELDALEILRKQISEYNTQRRKCSRKWTVILKTNQFGCKQVEEGTKKDMLTNWRRQKTVLQVKKSQHNGKT